MVACNIIYYFNSYKVKGLPFSTVENNFGGDYKFAQTGFSPAVHGTLKLNIFLGMFDSLPSSKLYGHAHFLNADRRYNSVWDYK